MDKSPYLEDFLEDKNKARAMLLAMALEGHIASYNTLIENMIISDPEKVEKLNKLHKEIMDFNFEECDSCSEWINLKQEEHKCK